MRVKRVLAPWYKLVVVAWAALFGGTIVAYALGAGGVRYTATNATTSFSRDADYALLRLNDSLALHVYPADTSTTAVIGRFEPASLVGLGGLLGHYEGGNPVMAGVTHRHGDWFYSRYPQYTVAPQPQAYNLRTNERLHVPGLDRHNENLRLADVPAFASRGLLGEAADKLPAPAQLAQTYPPLDVVKESKVVFVGAYLLLAVVLLLILPFAWRKVQVV